MKREDYVNLVKATKTFRKAKANKKSGKGREGKLRQLIRNAQQHHSTLSDRVDRYLTNYEA